MDLFSLTGKTAIVTGGSRGIGRAIAIRMAEAGANIIVTSRKIDACNEVVDEITKAGGKAVAIACNISNLPDIDHMVGEAKNAFGGIDILVGNAATNPHYGPVTDVEEPAFNKIIDTNLKSNLWLCKAVLPEMAERGGGAVILLHSVAGIRGTDDIGAYGMSKAAVGSLARSLAVGWGKKNIRVNCIAPGLVKTDFARALWEDTEKLKKVEAVYPLGRIGEPDDISGVAVCLAAPAGAFITGQTIVVDGGITMVSARS